MTHRIPLCRLLLSMGALCFVCLSMLASAKAELVLIDLGNSATFRGVSVTSPDANGNYWNSRGYGYAANLINSSGVATTIDYAPDGFGGTDSYNGPAGATSNPVTAVEIAAADAAINNAALGNLGIAEAAMDFMVSSNGTTGVGRLQLQQLDPGLVYDFTFYGSHKYSGSQTKYSIFDDSSYSNLLGSVTLTHGDGAGNHNSDTVAAISGIPGPSNANNILYVQWEGVGTTTQGYLNAMRITSTAVPEASQVLLFAAMGGVFCWRSLRKRT